jgi:1-acyl-sn-glycerol-3-phosphate acyltransferase
VVKLFQLFVGGISWPVVALLYRLRATGVENVPAEGGLVIGSNHISNLDPWAVCLPLWPRRRFRFMGKSELFNPLLKPIITAAGAFPVRRGEGDRRAIETAIRVVREGDVLAMFPEGTRRKKGLVKRHEARPHSGSARIALAAGVPLVPAAISGTDRLLRLGPLRVAYGSPIPVDDLGDRSDKEAAQIATERLMAEIERLRETL